MIGDTIDADADRLAVAFVELRLEPGHVSEFGGAHRGEIFRVRKHYCPAVANPLVKADWPLGRIGRKIRRLVIDS